VDLATEYRIQQALKELMKGRTSFVIAQRISTVLNADQILVLDKGQIVARGTHEELLESSEIYAEIYHSQLVGDAEETSALPHRAMNRPPQVGASPMNRAESASSRPSASLRIENFHLFEPSN
jgi:ABC-type multidrug transport system ATPase subunit